ncbi:hypothetical protein COCNU_13G000870 [Cocos nucifera]|uniref:Uncharacterized protein n=1 Tax=Cocos nucifera TaxID=13894 RepID=A0A8K0IS24_COCNU|nr:hypothetical protein COCNU_13G000870 [Cocos nucifera]
MYRPDAKLLQMSNWDISALHSSSPHHKRPGIWTMRPPSYTPQERAYFLVTPSSPATDDTHRIPDKN